MTNQEFTKNPLFREACYFCQKDNHPDKIDDWHKLATKRQASKFRNKKGIVYGYKKMAQVKLTNEKEV